MKRSNSDILNGCKQGDRKAQGQLYHLLYEPLANAAIRYALDSSHAKDLVHDTFVSCFKNIKQFRGNSDQLLPWMKRILINQALGQYRKNKKMESTDYSDYEEKEDKRVDLNETIFYEDILLIISKMNKVDQLIINLSIVEGYSHKEISQLLEITVVNSRKRLSRAKVNLIQLLKVHQIENV